MNAIDGPVPASIAVAGGHGRISAAAVVVPVFLLPADRLLRAAPGARCDGRRGRRGGGVFAGDDRLVRGARRLPWATSPCRRCSPAPSSAWCCCSRSMAGWSAVSRAGYSCPWCTWFSSPAWSASMPRSIGETPGRGAVFFIWVAVFNLFAVSVFWSFMADIFSNSEAKRVYGYIGAGGTLGGLTGPWLTKSLVLGLGVANMMWVSIACLAICLVCIIRLGGWARQVNWRAAGPTTTAMGGSIMEGLRLIARDPLLRCDGGADVFRRRRRHAALQPAARDRQADGRGRSCARSSIPTWTCGSTA